MPKILFQKKIDYLYEQLNTSDKEFTKIFSEQHHKYSNRNKTVILKWLKGEMKEIPKWNFNKYPISTYVVDGHLIFTEKSFLNETFLEFKDRVDKYILKTRYPIEKKFEFEYKYIYYFNINLKKILFLKLKIIEENNKNYIIELIPSTFYEKKGIDKYRGKLIISKYHYYISATNSSETVTFYFLLNRGFRSNPQLYGLSLELSYESLSPTSKTRILTKDELTSNEESKLYLTLNETEYLISNETFNSFYTDTKTKYFNQFYKKITSLKKFVLEYNKNLEKEVKSDTYLNIFYDTFSVMNTITEHVYNDKSFFVFNRKRVYKEFLKSSSYINKNIFYIVTSISDTYINFFNQDSTHLRNIYTELITKDIKIEHIFILDKDYKLNYFMQKIINNFEKDGLIIKFLPFDNLKSLNINSYDFLLSKKENVALYRNVHDYTYIYKITKDKDKIEKLFFDFQKIKKKSYSLKKFLLIQKNQEDNIFNQLVGTWYHYFYSSQKDKNNKLKIWKEKLIIEATKKVYYEYANEIVLSGEINLTFNHNEAFIYLTELDSGNLTLIKFDKKEVYKKIFKAPILDKELSTSRNMTSFGFFSKETINDSLVRKILGEEDKILVENDDIQNRINKYYNSKKYS